VKPFCDRFQRRRRILDQCRPQALLDLGTALLAKTRRCRNKLLAEVWKSAVKGHGVGKPKFDGEASD
jgi:hypothetical protein